MESYNEKYVRMQKEWHGRRIDFGSDVKRLSEDSTYNSILNANCKIVMYVDSVGCTRCNLRLYQWYTILAEIEKSIGCNIPFLICTNSSYYRELKYILIGDNYKSYVCLDSENNFLERNSILLDTDLIYRTFLLDENNNVLIVGNPTYNPKIIADYIRALLKNKS